MNQRIVLLSGLAGTAAAWRPLAERCGDYTLEFPEVPWSADSSHWQHNPTEVSDFFARSCFNADVVVAHSFAATLFLEYLTTSTSIGRATPRAAVLVSTFYRPSPGDFQWADIEYFLTHFDRILVGGIHASSTRALDPKRAEDMARIVRGQIGPYGWMAFYSAYLRTPWLVPSTISCPVSLVHGGADSAAPVEDSRALFDSFDAAGLNVLEGIGHFPMRDASEHLFEAIRSVIPNTIRQTGARPSIERASK